LQQTPLSSLLSPLSLSPGFDSLHLDSIYHKDGLQCGFEPSCVSEPSQSHPIDDEDVLSPLYWGAGRTQLLASPFSEDSDSDDGLAPSPFSSPESSGKPETDEDARGCLFFPPSDGYRHLPGLELFRDRTLDDAPLSLSHSPPSSPPTSIPEGRISVSPSPFFSNGIEEGLQSPSLSPTPLPGFNSFYYFDHQSSAIPGSPRYRAVDLPAFENEIDSTANHFGLGLHPMACPFENFPADDQGPSPLGISQRTTWLSLPGADTDDDLIPAELGSKTYIPDPSITIPTTPLARSLLIWDPNTSSGLPPGLPSFDGMGHTAHRFDVDALPIGRPRSPEDDFDVDPALLAKLAEKDAEKGAEVQKLCELRQRTNMAAATACKGREGVQSDVERVREKWREVTALLRLKLASDEETAKTTEDVHNVSEQIPNRGTEDGGDSPSSAPLLGISSLSLSMSSMSFPPTSSSNSEALPNVSSNFSTSDCSQIIRRRTSKPKITSMAQLVANMVFHRQQDALRRSPIRSRTWSPVASTMHTTSLGKTRSWTQTSPTSPLRQMILPEDLDSHSDSDEDIKFDTKDCLDSPLQLSPLCLTLSGSPESFYAQLEATPSVPFPLPNNYGSSF
jgi:hypothetical protein